MIINRAIIEDNTVKQIVKDCKTTVTVGFNNNQPDRLKDLPEELRVPFHSCFPNLPRKIPFQPFDKLYINKNRVFERSCLRFEALSCFW